MTYSTSLLYIDGTTSKPSNAYLIKKWMKLVDLLMSINKSTRFANRCHEPTAVHKRVESD